MRRGAFLAVLAVLASACAVGPDYERPASLPAAPAFRDHAPDASTIADSAWFDVFGDPTLRALVERALANNRDLHVAVSRVEEQRYLAAVARSPLLPQIGYGAGAARSRNAFFGTADPDRGTENIFVAAANLSWEIDLWGRIRRSAEAARGELLATDAARRGVVLSLVSGVATAYFELRELDLELEIAKNATVSFQETLDLFGRRYRGGVASKLDSLRAEAALAQVAALVPETERRIVAKENEISVLIGEPAQATERGLALVDQPLAPQVPAGVPAQLLERRPDLIQAEETLVANNAAVGANFANYFPRIGLTAVGGAASHELSDLLKSGSSLWSLAGEAAGPLFTAGRTTYQWRASQAARDAAVASYEGSVLNALREVSDALTSREKLEAVRAQRERAVAALEESLKTARVRYTGGLATYLEVLDAQQQLYPEQLALAQARRDQLLAVVALYRALGGSWNQAGGAPEIPLPIAP